MIVAACVDVLAQRWPLSREPAAHFLTRRDLCEPGFQFLQNLLVVRFSAGEQVDELLRPPESVLEDEFRSGRPVPMPRTLQDLREGRERWLCERELSASSEEILTLTTAAAISVIAALERASMWLR